MVIFTEHAAREALEKVMQEALSNAGMKQSHVRAVCLGLSGVSHPKDQENILSWLRFVANALIPYVFY